VIADLHAALVTKTCTFCKRFGTHLSILTTYKVCKACLASRQELHIVDLPRLSTWIPGKLPLDDILASFPVLRTVHGFYHPSQLKHKGGEYLVLSTTAMDILRKHGVADIAGVGYGLDDWLDRLWAATVIPYLNSKTGCAERGISCRACTECNTASFIRLPWPSYSRNSFLSDHFLQCKHAQTLWKKSQNGTADLNRLYPKVGDNVLNDHPDVRTEPF
jgi:hypothetical protein